MTVNSGWTRYRGATEAEWEADDPVLPRHAMVVSEDLDLFKLGDGVSRWSDLPYVNGMAGPQGPPGTVTVPEYAGGDLDEGTLVLHDGELWRANDDLVDQDPDTLDENNFDGPWPPAATTTGRAIAFAIIFGG